MVGTIDVKVRGPLLTGYRASQVLNVVELELQGAIIESAEKILEFVRAGMYPGHGVRTGNLRDKSIKVRGRSAKMRRVAPAPRDQGKARTVEGIGKRNRKYGFGGIHMFSKAAAKGGPASNPIAKKHAAHIARELNGGPRSFSSADRKARGRG